ncbi:unnamed protein product [Lactuca virosa]|uniref:TFIIS N-terminal domain-containing protein n=1 Tax=Lactuca virosa TaxID=75947 RepID=A0AAU9N3N8_9ASTR|nr:unnamed protein product [Lactuca virosa]
MIFPNSNNQETTTPMLLPQHSITILFKAANLHTNHLIHISHHNTKQTFCSSTLLVLDTWVSSKSTFLPKETTNNLMEDSKCAALMCDWRDYLRGENGDIFEIIKRAIMVAASDQPTEFQSRRHKIALILLSDELIKHYECDKCQKQSPKVSHEMEDETKLVSEVLSSSVLCKEEVWERNNSHGKPPMEKQIVPTCKQQRPTMAIKLKLNTETKFQIQKGPVTPEEKVDDLGDTVAEVLKMKKILDKSGDESQSELVVCELLKMLQSMELSMKTLEATMIGRTVSALKKHSSEKVCRIAVTLMKSWKRKVDEWLKKESNDVKLTSSQLVKPTNLNMNTERKLEGSEKSFKDWKWRSNGLVGESGSSKEKAARRV